MGKRMPVMLIAITVAACVGCRSAGKGIVQPSDEAPSLPAASAVQYIDIPVPALFEYLPGRSFSSQGRDYRVGELVYKGKADALDIIRFYHEQMPANGWQEVRNLDLGVRAILFFRKEQEHCIVIIERGTLSNTVRIWIH